MASKIEVPPAIHLRPEDNVAIATRTLETGVSINVGGDRIAPSKRIGLGHKMALKNIKKGGPIGLPFCFHTLLSIHIKP